MLFATNFVLLHSKFCLLSLNLYFKGNIEVVLLEVHSSCVSPESLMDAVN